MKLVLAHLPYELDTLEPSISKKTLEYHHGKHHQTYFTNLNNLITGTKFENTDLETIIKIAEGPVFNNAAQVWNHTFYFEELKAGKGNSPSSSFTERINSSFGSFSFFRETFIRAGVSLFGSGWVWLVMNIDGSLEILQETNSGNPLRRGLIPLLTCDVWEHAYYLDYQHRRLDYIEAFWKLINWDLVEYRYNAAL